MSEFETVVITGCNRGLGLEFVRQLAPLSERIVAACREPGAAQELTRLAASAGNIEVVPLDVCDPAQINQLDEGLNGSAVDLLVNNAGVGNWDSYPLAVDAWEQVFRINTVAPIKLSEALVDHVAASRRRLIANVTSKMGSIADNNSGGSIIYRSSKAALNAASRSFALDHAERGVTTLLFHPGWVRTDMGGPNGLIDAPESVAGMITVLSAATPSQNGNFFDYAGDEVPW